MKKIVALVLAMVMVLGLATTAFAAKGGLSFGEAETSYGWDVTVLPEDAADEKDCTFATYSMEAVAAKKGVDMWWTDATETDVKAGDEEDVELDGKDEFVKVADEAYADVVVVDGKTITYYAKADTYNEKGWAGKAVKTVLPGYPLDAADVECNTLYNNAGYPGTFYFYENALYVSAKGGIVLNVDGVVVEAKKATEGNYKTGADYVWNEHVLKVHYSNQPFDTVGNFTATKVYCNNCKDTFAFVQGTAKDAAKAFGSDNYQEVEAGVWVEYISAAIPGVTGGTPAVDAPVDNTVESPKTFDAGIAMYVGMSVMAAAGSAVVLKKKD